MKLKFLGLLSAVLLILVSCSENDNPGAKSYGEIHPTIKANNVVQQSRPLGRDGESIALSPELSSFSIKVSKKDGTFSKSWETLDKFDPNEQFTTGGYKVEASYGSIDDEGFDKPYYYGSADVDVTDSETAEPQIEAALANTMVSLNYTEAFKKYFVDYKAIIHSDGGAYIDFAKEETRSAYVKPGRIALELSLTKSNGVSFTFNPADIEKALPRTHYNVTFDVNGGEVGDAELVIRFDSTTDVEPISIVLSDGLIYTPAPTATPKGYIDGQTIAITEGASAGEVKNTIVALAGLSEVNLTTSSEYLLSKGWPAEINLINATETQKTLMQSLGLKVSGLWKNPDKMAMIDFSGLIPNLRTHNGSIEHLFTLQVKDKYTKVSEPVQLKVQATSLKMVLSNPTVLKLGQTSETVRLYYNGADISNNVTIHRQNASGTWENCPISNISSLGNDEYNITFTIPVSAANLKIKAMFGTVLESASLTIERENAPFEISMLDADVWTNKTTLSIAPSDASLKSVITDLADVYIKTSSGSYVKETNITKDTTNGKISISGLTPGTSYVVKVTYNGGVTYSNEVAFTTEAETQLQNANMESWYTVASGSSWWNYGCGTNSSTIWGTLNPLTTASGANYSYCKPSGTLATTEAHSGTNAALIRTVGYGSGNTAGGSASVVNNVAAGELYTGTYDSGAKYGISFSSRPKTLEFYYRYTPTTKIAGDYFVAEIVVKDALGNEIGKGTFTSNATTNTYTKAAVTVTYTKVAKAAQMYVLFKSSGNSDCIKRGALTLPGFGFGYEKFVTVGSQLYVDDIALKY